MHTRISEKIQDKIEENHYKSNSTAKMKEQSYWMSEKRTNIPK